MNKHGIFGSFLVKLRTKRMFSKIKGIFRYCNAKCLTDNLAAFVTQFSFFLFWIWPKKQQHHCRNIRVWVMQFHPPDQSHYKEVTRWEIFFGTGIEIWAGFGPVRQLLRPIFSCFHGQKNSIKNIVGRLWKHFWHIMKLKKNIFLS